MIRTLSRCPARRYAVFAGLALPCLTAFLFPAPAPAQRWNWPEKAENLKVLPEDFGGQRLRSVMTGFSRALGVRCTHCHVGVDGESFTTFDFVSDEKEAKKTARVMLEMLGDINDKLDEVERSGPEPVNMWCHTCHRGCPRPMRLDEELLEVAKTQSVDEAVERYRMLHERFYGRGSYDFGEATLNTVGYTILASGTAAEAIRIFELNVEAYPESGNVYDSLAEAYLENGDRDLAILYYEKSLEITPDNANAAEQLEKIRGKR